MAALDRLRQVPMELVRSVFNDPRVTYDGTYYIGPPGLAAYFSNFQGEGTGGLIFACPGDGRVSAICFEKEGARPSWTWNGNRTLPTCKPSIQCTRPECGWHGWLTDGKFHL